MQLDLVPVTNVRYPVFLIIDPTVLVAHFSYQVTSVNSLETGEHILKSRFFSVKGVPLTSFKENLIETSEQRVDLTVS